MTPSMLSIVIPVLNEASSLAILLGEIMSVVEREGLVAEVIFVDDGSSDTSWQVIQQLSRTDHRVRGIRFRRNFGKAAALQAGFARSNGDCVMTLDADLQDDPREIPRFLEAMDHLDVVSGWKQVRHDPWHKVLPSRVFNWMVSRTTGVSLHDHNCGFKCYRGEIFREVRLYGELHRFVPVLAAARGWRVGELVVQHRSRQHGQSKYGWERIVKGFLDLVSVKFVTGYGQRPQHVLGGLGLLGFLAGSLGSVYLAWLWISSRLNGMVEDDVHLHTRALFYYALVSLLLGAQFMGMGLLAELFTSLMRPDISSYSIAECVGDDGAQSSTIEATDGS